MPFAIEFAAACERDFELIFDHLFTSYCTFGESTVEALEHASRRLVGIRRAAERLGTFPLRGTTRDDILPGVRYLAIDQAIYWFEVDEKALRVRVLAIFFGGQDHIRHMLVRQLRDTR